MKIFSSGPISNEHIELAEMNYEAQEALFVRLREAFEMSSLTLPEVGEELGLSPDEARDWLWGEVNLTLSELRQLANAVDAHVSYKTHAVHTQYVDRFLSISTQWIPTSTEWDAPVPQDRFARGR